MPAHLPAERSYGSFDAWNALGNRLVAYYRELTEAIEHLDVEDAPAADAPVFWRGSERPEAKLKRLRALDESAQDLLARFSANDLADAAAAFVEGHAYYERDALYEPPDRRIVSRKFVASRVAMLLGAFPAGSPPDPDVYTRRLVEEVIAAEPSATRVEYATRVLIRTTRFLPAPSEMLAAINVAQTPEWDAFAEDETGVAMVVWARGALERMVSAKAHPRMLPPGGAP